MATAGVKRQSEAKMTMTFRKSAWRDVTSAVDAAVAPRPLSALKKSVRLRSSTQSRTSKVTRDATNSIHILRDVSKLLPSTVWKVGVEEEEEEEESRVEERCS